MLRQGSTFWYVNKRIMANKIDRVPVREQDPKVRATNFEEVCYGYNAEEAMLEASRCLNCKKPRCVESCPVGIKIPNFIAEVFKGDFNKAFDIISEDSSLPAICGRVCPQETQCEGSCILGVKGQPVSIGKLERFVADHHSESANASATRIEEHREFIKERHKEFRARLGVGEESVVGAGHKVAVIGSGPSGLACASDLAKMGYSVTIFESLHKAGGVLTYGIPEFRLPKKKVVEKELQSLFDLGVKIETNVFVGRTVTIDDLLNKEGFKAVFVGTGAGLPLFLNIPGENLNGVFSANEYLTRNNLMQAFDKKSDTPIFHAKRVCVVGGGNVAMDAARTALRLGADVTIIYRRGEKELPARAEEVHHAKQEGVKFQLLTNPTRVIGDENGWVKGVECIRMELGEPDESGRRSPQPVAGSEFVIDTDALIVALGTKINRLIADTTPNLETDKKGRLVTSGETATSRAGVFAGGDVVTGAATVILAMGEGRRAAKAIDRYIKERY